MRRRKRPCALVDIPRGMGRVFLDFLVLGWTKLVQVPNAEVAVCDMFP